MRHSTHAPGLGAHDGEARGRGTDPQQDHANFRHAVMEAVKQVVADPDE
jgi:hypothetical protein